MPPKVPPVQNITFDKPSSYKVKSVFLTFITKVLETKRITVNSTP